MNKTQSEWDSHKIELNSRLSAVLLALNGGKGSGNFGHSGRPGMIGGSGKGTGSAKSTPTSRDARTPKVIKMDESTCGIPGDRVLGDDEKVPRLAGLSSAQEKIENDFAQNWENKEKRKAALAELERQAIEKGNKDYDGTPAFETDGIKQLDKNWGTDKEIKTLAGQEKNYEDKRYYESLINAGEKLSKKQQEVYDKVKDTKPLTEKEQKHLDTLRQYRSENNSVLHQTANALAKQGFEDYMKKNPGKEIIVTLGGCASGKGYGLEHPGAIKGKTSDGKTMTDIVKGKNKVIWDSAGDQGGDELNWIATVAQKSGSKVVFINTVTDSVAAAGNAINRVRQNGRLVAAQTFNESYTKTEKNFASFKSQNKNNPDYTFVTVDNPGYGKGDATITTKNRYKTVSDSEMKKLVNEAIENLPSQLRDSAHKGADFTFTYK